MKYIIEIGHPAHVHHFKYLYWELKQRGHDVLIIARDKECVVELLKSYRMNFSLLGKTSGNLLKKIISIFSCDFKLLRISKKYKPDIFISRVSPASSHVSYLMKKPHICFADTETSRGFDWIATPFVDVFLTSISYKRNHGKKQIRYSGYHELAYLHPNRYTPNPEIYRRLHLSYGEKYAIIRFVSWSAHHDIGQKGFTIANKIRLVKELRKYLDVYISSEGDLPEELFQHRINIEPHYMHDSLYYAHLFIGESGTMASECAVLGTPAIFINNNRYGCIDDQASYGLLYQFGESEQDQIKAIKKAVELAKEDNKKFYSERRDRMLKEKIDVTSFMVWFVENFPESKKEMTGCEFDYERFTK
jgi:hypothetical protein